MEKQRVFWVVLAVSVFVIVVLLVGVFLLRQRSTLVSTTPGTVNPISNPGTQIYEYQREKAPGTTAAPSTPGGQPPGETQTMHFYIGEGGEQVPAPSAQPPAPQPSGSQPAAAAPPQATSVKAAPTPPAAAPKAAAPSKPAAPASQKTIDYWIQTGSYKSQSRAEELATLLAGQGLSARVFSYAGKSATYFRVRIGPYASRGEAEKFLALVRQVQGLESSYISQVTSVKGIN
jgi:cell division protein FtsN